MEDLGFPLWIRLTHFFNLLFITLLFRSGLEILASHPMLYWNDHCTPGSEWIKFSRKRMPQDRLWTATDEAVTASSWWALPGKNNLGLGRFWHFVSAIGWVIAGVLYVSLLFITPQWQRLIPTSWAIFPQAWDVLLTYFRFQLPETTDTFNALQQLVYASLIFLVTPIQALTGVAMSPAVAGRFPRFPGFFGGHQAARSLHFLGLVVYGLFTVVHVINVSAHGLGKELAKIVLGVANHTTATQEREAMILAAAGLLLVVALHVWATRASLLAPRRVQNLLLGLLDPLQHVLFRPLGSRQRYDLSELSPFLRPNGYPPKETRYRKLLADGFEGWQLEVGGLVRKPLWLTLEDLRALPKQSQITKSICIQGWSQTSAWGGVPLRALIELCEPLAEAHYILFETFDDKWEKPGHGYYYGTLSLEHCLDPQTILAYELNDQPLPEVYGAPLRLRAETQLGYKMTKWIQRLVFIEDYRTIRLGQGGWREDVEHYGQNAPI